jgi:modulator of FtsH protease
MIAAYTTEGWGDLFLAAAGATAALSGLIFVGLSVNIRTVLAADKREGQNFLTGRALEALAALLIVLVISLVGLVPGIPRGALVAFILVTGACSAISPVRALVASRQASRLDGLLVQRLITAAGLTITLLLAGVTFATGHGGGLYWLPASFVLAIAVAAVNAWVLLVEVLR